MTSHFANEKYFYLNEKISEKLFQQKYKVRVYENAQLACYDLTTSLQHYLSHKPQLALCKNGSSLIEGLCSIWLRSSTALQMKSETQNWIEYIESLDPETNFVMWASENEITGEILVDTNLAQEIHQRLAKKRIFSIQITHHLSADYVGLPFSIIILRPSVFLNSKSMVVLPEKFKATNLIAAFQDLKANEDDFTHFILPTKNQSVEEKKLNQINEIENQILNQQNVYFKRFVSTTPRLADRLVLSYLDVNAYAIQQDIKLSDQICFAPCKYPFWILDTWKNWWKESQSESLLRGLLVIDILALRNNAELISKINESVAKFQRLGQMIDL